MKSMLRALAVWVSFWISISAYAGVPIKKQNAGYLGGLLGFSTVTENIGGGLAYGLQGAYFFSEQWGAGAFLRGANHANGITSFFFAGEALFRFADMLPGLQLGAVIGSGKFAAGDVSGKSAVAYGFKAAFDVPVLESQPVTLGVDLNLVWLKPGTVTLTAFTPTATAKWWF